MVVAAIVEGTAAEAEVEDFYLQLVLVLVLVVVVVVVVLLLLLRRPLQQNAVALSVSEMAFLLIAPINV